MTITSASGQTVATLTGPARRGLNRVLWSLGGGGGRGGGGGGQGGAPAGPPAVGQYTVTLDVGGEKMSKPAQVRARIGGPR